MARTDRPSAPWARRAQAGTLPPSAHGARAYSSRSAERAEYSPTDAGALRIDTGTGTYTVADLQRAARAESQS